MKIDWTKGKLRNAQLLKNAQMLEAGEDSCEILLGKEGGGISLPQLLDTKDRYVIGDVEVLEEHSAAMMFRCFEKGVEKEKLYLRFGLLPSSLLAASPFHGSMFITSMASLNIPPIRHHLYNFGNVPVFIAFGAKRPELVLNEDGSVTKRRVVDFVANLDERICDGYYYASALKMFKKYLVSPEGLLDPPEQVVEDLR